jgi:hypothetical protein
MVEVDRHGPDRTPGPPRQPRHGIGRRDIRPCRATTVADIGATGATRTVTPSTRKETHPMPLVIAIAVVVLPLVVLAIAVRQTVRIEALRGGYPTVSLTYRAYGA